MERSDDDDNEDADGRADDGDGTLGVRRVCLYGWWTLHVDDADEMLFLVSVWLGCTTALLRLLVYLVFGGVK